MKKHSITYIIMLILGGISTGFLLYNMVAIPFFKEQIFLERSTITIGGELFVLIGFIHMAIFNVMSIFWIIYHNKKNQMFWKSRSAILTLGFLCLLLMAGEKVIVDEIGREYLLGWEVVGEWIILYIFLVIQLIYTLLILLRLYQSNNFNTLPYSTSINKCGAKSAIHELNHP